MKEEITKHMAYLFGAALRKSGSLEEANELTQEVLLAALTALDRGKIIENPRAWLSATLDHKFYDHLRQKYRLPTISIDILPEEEAPIAEEASERPDAEEVRRQVAYLTAIHREVIVRHYLLGQKVEEIAQELGIPRGTVLSRLSAGREQMRKGLKEMESYEKQSYRPERLEITVNGNFGLHDEPWRTVNDDLMKQNILIVSYEAPRSIPEIAKALGIPTPYIENAVDTLLRAELMARVGERVFTDFQIQTPAQILRVLDEGLEFAQAHHDAMWDVISKLLSKISQQPWYVGLDARRQSILALYSFFQVFSHGIYRAMRTILGPEPPFPSRPDGGSWIAQGHWYPADFDFSTYRFAHCCYGGERRARFEQLLGVRSVELHVYDTQPNLNRYQHGPVEVSDEALCRLLFLLHQQIPFEAVGFDSPILQSIPHLVECGILARDNGSVTAAIPVLSQADFEVLLALQQNAIERLSSLLEEPIRTALPCLRYAIPRHLTKRIAAIRQYSLSGVPVAVIQEAIRREDFTDLSGGAPAMVLVVEK